MEAIWIFPDGSKISSKTHDHRDLIRNDPEAFFGKSERWPSVHLAYECRFAGITLYKNNDVGITIPYKPMSYEAFETLKETIRSKVAHDQILCISLGPETDLNEPSVEMSFNSLLKIESPDNMLSLVENGSPTQIRKFT